MTWLDTRYSKRDLECILLESLCTLCTASLCTYVSWINWQYMILTRPHFELIGNLSGPIRARRTKSSYSRTGLGLSRPHNPDQIFKNLMFRALNVAHWMERFRDHRRIFFAKNCKDDIYLCLLIELTSCFDFEYSLRAYNTCMELHKMISKHELNFTSSHELNYSSLQRIWLILSIFTGIHVVGKSNWKDC